MPYMETRMDPRHVPLAMSTRLSGPTQSSHTSLTVAWVSPASVSACSMYAIFH